jgi:octanoyl-[GcvH]:protein N-octanoyltransferase
VTVTRYSAPVKTPLLLLGGSWADEPGLDTALSSVILSRVAAGSLPATMRLYVPGREVAFGKRDTVTRQYPAAVAAAREVGFGTVERLAGGRAAVFTEGTIAFSLALPDPDPRSTVYDRFEHISSIMVTAFARLGVVAAVGEVAGEYCPGAFSVHHDGRIKLMGVGQRLAKTAAHVGGVIAVSRRDLLLRALIPVYRALELEWRPATAGVLSDVRRDIDVDTAMAAVRVVLGEHYAVTKDRIDGAMVDEARPLVPDFLPGEPDPHD